MAKKVLRILTSVCLAVGIMMIHPAVVHADDTITILHSSGFIKAVINPASDLVQVSRNIGCTDSEISAGHGCTLESWQDQWYHTGNNGLMVWIDNGTNTKLYRTWYAANWYPNVTNILPDGISSVQTADSVTVSYQLYDYNTVTSSYDIGTGIFVTHTTYFIDAFTVGHKYTITNKSGTAISRVKVFRVGDTTYNGQDSSYGIASNADGSVFIRDASLSGGVAQYGTFDNSADYFYEGDFSFPIGNIISSASYDLPSTVNTTQQDGGVSFQWNISDFADNASFPFSIYERYSTTGSALTLTSATSNTVDVSNGQQTVTKIFSMMSLLNGTNTADASFSAISSLGYPVSLDVSSYTFTGVELKTVKASVTYPQGIATGTDDIVFTVQFTPIGGSMLTKTGNSAVTIIDSNPSVSSSPKQNTTPGPFTVTFLDCNGETVSVQSVPYQGSAKAPTGYGTYEGYSNVSAHMDLVPTSCSVNYSTYKVPYTADK